uniref:Uncharacterized protein n=1 Tax=Timema cristinae TaxID=61476 RepID=A0A7R9GZG2_TIMCR|nr:unnamed protein product [Timema cristinae]
MCIREKRIEELENWCYRRIFKISWTDKVKNKEMFVVSGELRIYGYQIQLRRDWLIGHSLCHNCLLTTTAEEDAIEGRTWNGRLNGEEKEGDLEAEIKNLRSIHAEAERSRQQLLELTARLHQQEGKNAVPEHIFKMDNSREPSRDACTSPIKSTSDALEDARRECARGYAEKLAILESKHRIELDEMQEKIKDETVNFFAEEIRKMETKHRAALEQYQSAAGKQLYSLQNLIESKASEVNSLKQVIQAEKINLKLANNEEQWKAKVESLTKEERSHPPEERISPSPISQPLDLLQETRQPLKSRQEWRRECEVLSTGLIEVILASVAT